MKCPKCSAENKSASKFCSECGAALPAAPKPAKSAARPAEPAEPLWKPDWRWHLRALGGIFVFLIAVYFAVSALLSRVPPPFRMRDIPEEMTPWLKK
jgi:hypothetical protein